MACKPSSSSIVADIQISVVPAVVPEVYWVEVIINSTEEAVVTAIWVEEVVVIAI